MGYIDYKSYLRILWDINAHLISVSIPKLRRNGIYLKNMQNILLDIRRVDKIILLFNLLE